MPDLPTGTVTFLFTDIQGSAKLWEQFPEAMRDALARHDALVRHAIESHGGYVFKTMGDSFCSAFTTAPDALDAALAAQRALQSGVMEYRSDGVVGQHSNTPTLQHSIPLRVRIALHTGAAEERDGDYFGQPVNRVARLLSAAHGGQMLLSAAVQELVRDHLPAGVELCDLGERRLKDLVRPERIFQIVAPDLPAEFPPLRSLDAFPHNLPVQLTSFIGREREMEEVKRLLKTTRLLTLTGPGGTGKTRLSLQVAADLLDEYADGVWLVELAPLSDPAFVPQTVADVLGVREEPGVPLMTSLTTTLRPRQLLLILDNCEHLVQACAQLAEASLRSCPNLRILASSREGLGIAGETAFRVPSLSLPDPKQWEGSGFRVQGSGHGSQPSSLIPYPSSLIQYEAVRLFIDRAVAVKQTFTVTNQNAPAVAQICWRLDGIPLAIELAAARVKVLTAEQIAARLDDRFRLLTGGSRTALPRQQTLRALIDWSYDLLSESERILLRRLSVFVGGWMLEAAEAVCADGELAGWRVGETTSHQLANPPTHQPILPYDVLDLLTQLVDKSLVVAEEHNGEAWYRLLETVRQYARDRLLEAGEAAAFRARHRAYFLAFAEKADEELSGVEQATWLNRLEADHDNLRTALEWSETDEDGAEIALRLVGALWEFWFRRGHLSEGRGWAERALSRRAGVSEKVLTRAFSGAGHLAWSQGDTAAAKRFHEESLSIRREMGDRMGIASSLNNLALVARDEGEYAAAHSYLEESLRIYRESGETAHIARGLGNLGTVAMDQEDLATSKSLLEEALTMFRQLNDAWCIAIALHNLGEVAWRSGDYGAAGLHLREGLRIRQELGDQPGIAHGLEGLADVARCLGQAARAARLWGAAEGLRETLGNPMSLAEKTTYESNVAAVRESLGLETFAAAWAAGRAMTLAQAVAYALEEPLSANTAN